MWPMIIHTQTSRQNLEEKTIGNDEKQEDNGNQQRTYNKHT